MDVLTVTSIPAVPALGPIAATPATVDAMFESILQNMNESATPQIAPQMPVAQSAATPLGGFLAVLQKKTDIVAPAGLPGTGPDMRFGPLIVPGDTFAEDACDSPDADSQAQQMAQAPMPFPFRPSVASGPPPATDQNTDTTSAAPSGLPPAAVPAVSTPAPVQVSEQDSEQDAPDGVMSAPSDGAEQPQPEKNKVAQQIPLEPVAPPPVAPHKPSAIAPDVQATDETADQPAPTKATSVTKPKTASNNAGKEAAAQSPLPQPVPVEVTDSDTPPPASDGDGTGTQPQQVASADPAPPVFVAPMPAPVQAAPAAKPATDAVSPVTIEAPKGARAQAAADSNAANQTTPAVMPKAHEQSIPNSAAPKPDVAAAPASGQSTPALTDTSNNGGAVQSNSAPQADNPAPTPPHQSTAQPPTPPVANPAAPLAAPLGLRKLTGGLQLSAQEQETTSTLDKIGVSIVTRATEGLRHFDIRLDPPELGRVDVRLSVDDSGKAQASLIVDKQQTLDMLQRDSSSLHRALSDAGLDMSNNGLNFSLRDPNRQNDGGVDQGRNRGLSVKAVVQTDATPIHSSLGSYAPNSVRLDIRV